MITLLLASLAAASPIHGRVLLEGTGKALPDITVRVDGSDRSAETDATGSFTLDLPDGTWTIWLDSVDHVLTTVTVTAPVDEPLVIYLVEHKGHEIVVESFKQTAHVARHVVDAEMALETPGTLEDSVRLVQSLPGVAVRREYSPGQADLSVRGSGPGDNRYLLDGVDVPYLYHFNQYASVFPTTQIDTLELFPSTFGSAYGDAIGGVIDARSRQETPDGLHGTVSVSTVMGSASVETPLGDQGWWASASGRRSYQDLFNDTSEQYTLWPVFGDFSIRAGRESERSKVHLFAWGASDSYDRAAGELDLLDPTEIQDSPSFAFRRGFQVVGAQLQHQGDDASIDSVIAYVHDGLSASLTDNGSERLVDHGLQHRTLAKRTLSRHFQLEGGLSLRGNLTDLRIEDPGDDVFLIAREAPELGTGRAFDDAIPRLRAAGHVEVHWITEKLRVMPGVRVPVDTLVGPLWPEPRLATRWQLADQTALKFGAGHYQQNLQTELWAVLPEGTEVIPARSLQGTVGIEQTVANRLEFTLDGYYKDLHDPLYFDARRQAAFAERGEAWGVELVTRYRMRETFFLWGWFSYARTLLTPMEGASPVSADGDQPLSAGIVSSWNPGKGWNIGARYRYGSGLPYTPIDGSVYDGSRDRWVPMFGQSNGDRYPAYQKFDLHFEKTFTWHRWSLALYAEGWVVPKKAAQLYPTWNYDYREQGWVVGPTFLPLFGGRAIF